jgi:outer membrane autotransporter protein
MTAVGAGDLRYCAGGGIYTRQDIDTGGHFREDAFYLAPEASIALGESNVYATVGAYYSSGRMDAHRGYLNGGSMDYSDGDADVDTWGGKIRFDWLNAATISDTKLTPYTSLTYAHSHMDGYTEEGGSFPSAFDAVNDHSTVARLGIDFVHDLTDKVRLTARTEADYRFEKNTAGTSGDILGISAFSLDGEEVRQFWLRGAIGTEFDVAGGTASLAVNVTSGNDDPDVWLRSGWSMKF